MISGKYKTVYQELNTPRGVLRGFLTEPAEKKDLVVMLHGYTGHKNENGFLFKQIASRISEIGVASLRFDFMGSGDSDGDYVNMTFLGEVEDAKDIIDYAYELNGNKPIILLGFSMGGAVAGYVSKIKEEKIKKLVLMAPAGCMAEHAERAFIDVLTLKVRNADGSEREEVTYTPDATLQQIATENDEFFAGTQFCQPIHREGLKAFDTYHEEALTY